MFLGTYRHNLDIKNRLTIPSRILSSVDAKIMVVSKGFDGCLELRSPLEFKEYANKLLSLSQSKNNTRILLRQLLANAAEIDIDNVNRILIPSNLLQEAKIKKEIVLIGLGNKLEIWDLTLYEDFKKRTDNIIEELAETIENDKI